MVRVAVADGTGPATGTRVVGLADEGGWSERVAVPSHRVAALPAAVPFPQAASLPVAGLTAHVSGPSRVEQVQRLGPDAVVTEIGAGGGPFDLVLEGVGGSVLADAVRRLAVGGTVTAYGLAGGERSDLAFYDFAAAAPGGRLQGFFVYRTGEETFGEDLATLAALVADGRLEPPLGVVRDWSETVAAVDDLRGRRASGKVVLTRS